MNEIAAGTGHAVALKPGHGVRLVNTHGSQVVDTWAFSRDDPSEYLSMEHTRRMTGHLHPETGDVLWSNRRSPMLVLEEDSFPGTHDTIVACCDQWLYAHYGCAPGHANCHDNCLSALAGFGVTPAFVPSPLNLWMNVPVEGNTVSLTAPLSRPGDHVLLRARMDLLVVFSTCPMDVAPSQGAAPINGASLQPRSVHYELVSQQV